MDKDKSDKDRAPQSLTDDQIVTVSRKRRSFLGTAVLGSAALTAAAFVQSCKSSDRCDLDTTHFRDSDPFDLVTVQGDRCDTD